MAKLFEPPQSHVPGKTFALPLRDERLDRGFNFPLQILQLSYAVVDANPNDTRRAGIWEKADALGVQIQWRGAGAGRPKGFLQAGHVIGRNAAEKPEREVKLFRFGPANRAPRRQRLQLALHAKDFLPHRGRNRNRHEQPELFN